MGANLRSLITRMTHAEAITRTEPVVTAFTNGTPIEGPIPSCLIQPSQLKSLYENFREVNQGAETGDHAKTAERNLLRPAFNDAFIDLADFVELASRKDPALPYRAGFDYFWRTRKSGTTHSALAVPPTFTIANGPERGTVIGKVNAVAGAKSYEIQFTYGDPTVEANWSYLTVSGGTKIVIKNLEAGRLCSVRIRAVGTKETSPWSHHISLTVT